MLPKFLQSSFKTYKEDTNTIATWLALTAKQCGYPSDLIDHSGDTASSATQPSKRPKGNARKKVKNASKKQSEATSNGSETNVGASYVIKVRQFITLAECIAGSNKPVIKVPRFLVSALDRAIDLRKEHNEWSKKRKSVNRPTDKANDADEGHSFFLNILQQTREILKPRIPSEILADFLSKSSGDPEWQKTSELSNKFAEVNVQEPSQAFVDAPDVVPEPRSNLEPRYEAETVNTLEEQYLAVHCLFRDVRNIRSCVRQLWENYMQGMDIVAISVTTNTAIDFVRKLEREYLLQFPDKSNYEDIMDLFYKVQCVSRGHNPSHKQPDDPFNFEVYDLAEECLLSTYIILSSVQDVISPGHLPVCKPGHFGQRNLRSDWSTKSPREKFQDDKLVMLEAFPDLILMTMITEKSPLAEDELLRGFRNMAPSKDIPLWLVFAAQCFLDVQHVLKHDISRPHAELMNTANAIRASVKQNLNFHKSLHADHWPRTNDFQFSEILRVIEEWVRRDMVADKLRKVSFICSTQPRHRCFISNPLKTYNQRNMPVPDPEPFRLLKQYPLLCGLFMYTLKMRYQEVSIDFANAWGSVLFTGHLYNAVRQERLLLKPWKDMELVIIMQSPERMFVGGAPKGSEEYLKRFLLSQGYSATAFASNRRKSATNPSIRGPRTLMKLGTVAALFTGRYCNNDQTVSWTSESIKPIIESKLEDNSDDDAKEKDTPVKSSAKSEKKKSRKVKQSASGALLRKPKRDGTSIPTLDFLSDLSNTLHAEALELSIDYLRLHRLCWMLLRGVNDVCKPKLLELYGPGYLPKEHRLPYVIGYIFMAATTTSKVTNLLLHRRKDVEVSSRLLETAAKCIQDMVDSGAGDIELKILEDILGYPVDMGELGISDETVQPGDPNTGSY